MRESSINRVAGRHPAVPDIEHKVLERQKDVFQSQETKFLERLRENERSKTGQERRIIDMVNTVTNELLKTFSGEIFTVPEKNIHVIVRGANRPDLNPLGQYKQMDESIIVLENRPIVFARQLLHEIIHMKMYNSLQIQDAEIARLTGYRSGLRVVNRKGKQPKGKQQPWRLNNINEALVEELTIRCFERIVKDTVFESDLKRTRKIIGPISKGATNKTTSGVPVQEIYYAYLAADDSPGSLPPAPNTDFRTTGVVRVLRGQYPEERQVLNMFIDKIYQRSQENFASREEVFAIFTKAAITGHLFELAHLVDRTLGQDAFIKFANLKDNVKEERLFLEQF